MTRAKPLRLENFHVTPEQQIDCGDGIDTEERAEIEEGLVQADRGEVLSHEEVMAKYQKWRSK